MKDRTEKARLAIVPTVHTGITPGAAVVIHRDRTNGVDRLQGRTGVYLGLSPDGRWLRVNVAGIGVCTFPPTHITEVGS